MMMKSLRELADIAQSALEVQHNERSRRAESLIRHEEEYGFITPSLYPAAWLAANSIEYDEAHRASEIAWAACRAEFASKWAK